MSEIRAGVIGLGFIGQTHVRAYQHALGRGVPVRLATVADRNAQRLEGKADTSGNIGDATEEVLFDTNEVRTFTDAEDLIASDEVDLISICTHTDTHVDLAIRSLNAGKHVLVEKPVAQTPEQIEPLAEVARTAQARGTLCMPAMCMRFWPAWAKLKALAGSGELGTLRSATFQRLGSTPGWSDGFYKDTAKSGGALLDLHIHDTDFVLHLFGAPDAVFSTGDANHISTAYLYDDSPVHATAEGCWDRHPNAPFVMRFAACFEKATAIFDLGAPNELILYDDDGEHPISLPGETGWDMQIEALVGAISSGAGAPPVTIDDALLGMRIIDAERRSLASGKPEHVRT